MSRNNRFPALSEISILLTLAAGLLAATALAQMPTSAPPVSPLPSTLPGVPKFKGNTSLSQCPSAGRLTVPANYIHASQVPNSWKLGQIVIGKFNFNTNGKSPEYPLGAGSTTEVDEEHSLWCLTYSHPVGYSLQTNATWWHQKTVIQRGFVNAFFLNVSYDTKITVSTQDSLGNAPSDGQPTLTIQLGGPNGAQFRSLAMSSGVSLPQIYTETGTMIFYLKGGVNGTIINNPGPSTMVPDKNPMTVFLQISDWRWGQWDTPYSGEVGSLNDYITYITKPTPGVKWLDVDAIWNTKPGPGQ
jgi:hypothetical protein